MANVASKLRSKFPLITLHPTGQRCKRIRGTLYYFGTDKILAHERYLREAHNLHRGRERWASVRGGELTVKDLANRFLAH